MKQVTSPGLMHDTGCLGMVQWDDPEGWYGKGGGRRVQDGEHKKKKKKINIQKTKIMASSPITSWKRVGVKVETVTDFIFLGSKVTGDGDCSHEIKIHLLLGKKAMKNPDSILKSKDITLPTRSI